MAALTIFNNLTAATGAELDGNFSAIGANAFFPCTLAGTNAIALAPAAGTPTLSAYANYMVFAAVASGPNTTVQTVQVGALPALNVYKDSPAGPVALTGYELAAGNQALWVYDSALNSAAGGFHLFVSGAPAAAPPVGASQGLVGTAPGTAYTASWTIPEIVAVTALGGAHVSGANLSLSLNMVTNGANGLDTGTPASLGYAVYAIYNPTTATWATLATTYSNYGIPAPAVYPGGAMPSGYLFSALICVFRATTQSGAHYIPQFLQFDRTVNVLPWTLVNTTAVAANTYYGPVQMGASSLTAGVPFCAKTVWGTAGSASTSAAVQVAISYDNAGSFASYVVCGDSTAALDTFGSAGRWGPIPVSGFYGLYWKSGTNTVNTTITITGYTF